MKLPGCFLLIACGCLLTSCHRPDVEKKIDDLKKKQTQKLEDAVKEALAKGPKWEHINQMSPGPKDKPSKDELFPLKIGDFERTAAKADAVLADIGLKDPGERAVYQAKAGEVEIFAFRINLDKNRELREAVNAKKKAGVYAYSDFGAGGDVWNSSYRTAANEQGIYWCNNSWFYFVRSKDLENVGTFLDAYVDAVFDEGHGRK